MTRRDPLLGWRREFPIVRRSVYLVSHSMGAMPRRARARLRAYADDWERLGVHAWDRWMPRLRETADLVGSIFGAPPGTVVLHQNVSTLVSIALSAIVEPGARRDRVVYTDLNFPSLHYCLATHERLGLRADVVRSPDGMTIPTEAIVDAIDRRTLAVVLDHGIYRSGWLQDVATIVRAARARGAYTLVDAYQTVGCVPIDVGRWGVDFLVGGAHKWLCGGPGAAFLYVRRGLIRRLRPRITGWFSHRDPFAFAWAMDFAPDAMRFATGTPNMAGVHGARAGIEIVAQIGVARIREKSVRLTQKLVQGAIEDGLDVRSPMDPARRSGLVCIDFPGAARAERALLRRGVHVDYRPGCGLRVSPHFYTKEEELLSVLDEIRRLRRRRPAR